MADGHSLAFGILGPVEVRRDGEPLDLRAKQRALLALLLLNENQVTSTDRLIDALWGENPPATAHSALQVHVLGLRRLLEPDRGKDVPYAVLVTAPPGYALRIAPDQLDLRRFEGLVAEGSVALADGRAEAASAALQEALSLWRGPALADLAYESFMQSPAARLEELRLSALEKRIEADLTCGRHVELVAELGALAAEHPLRERLARHLMLALYRSGRQAEALEAFQRTRRVLVDELGIDPGPALQRLEREILIQDPSLELQRDAARLPQGTVALVFTDIEGSTALLEDLGERYGELLVEHRRIIRDEFGRSGGREVDRQGDGFFFVFARAIDAVEAAISAQRALIGADWPKGSELRVRMGLHTGTPTLAEEGYVGTDVHRAARIGAAAHGCQVVLSRDAAADVRPALSADVELRELGAVSLKGLGDPEVLYQLVAPGLPSEFPPPRAAGEPTPLAPPERAILVADGEGRIEELVVIVEPLARLPRPRELVIGRILTVDRGAELAEATTSLDRLRAALEHGGAAARVAAFTSESFARDVIRLAERAEVDLLVTSAPASIELDGMLGRELSMLLSDALCDVAFLVGRAVERPEPEDPVLVPFGAGEHDWAALELGAWLAAASGRTLQLLGTSVAETEAGRRDASRLLADAGLLIQRASGVTPVPRLVGPGRDGVLEAAAEGGLLVIGLSERWTQEGLGMTRWAIARGAAIPVLFVRRGLRPGGLAPPGSVTRFGWSVTVGG